MAVPAPDGALNPLVLAAARICRVDEILRIGGAQAIGALAHGTETITPVDKIVGPGNAYVAEAKRQVFGIVGIDMLAGPSEILILADATSDPAWIAADLLSQAEHDPAAQAILMVTDAAYAERVEAALEDHLKALPKADTARRSWRDWGAVIVLSTWRQAPPLIDRIAPEHLELAIEQPDELSRRVNNAGAIFMGAHTPEAIGDYLAGPSHVLPTGRGARFSSGLGVLDFLKRSSIMGGGGGAIRHIGPPAVTLARAEGLEAHALSVALRLGVERKD
jgi:histidinol dehydrogenase